MLYFAWREGPKPSQIESSNLGIVLLQVIGSWLRAKSGGRSHEAAAKADHGGTWGLFYNELYFTYCTVARCLYRMRNQVTLLARECPLSWLIGCFLNEPVLLICVFLGFI